MSMTLISLIIVLAVVGLILWLVTTYIPMNPVVRNIIVGVVVVCLILWLLQAFGVLTHAETIRVPGTR